MNRSHSSAQVEELNLCWQLAKLTGYATGAHVPRRGILSKYPAGNRGKAKKTLKKAVRMGYVARHPTRGEMTFHLTKLGLETLRKTMTEKGHILQRQCVTGA